MFKAEDGPYQKIVAIVLVLLDEIAKLVTSAHEKVYQPLLLFGEEKEFLSKDVVADSKECYVARIINVMHDIHVIIKSLNVLFKNLLNQLNCLYNANLREYTQAFKHILLIDAFDALGSALARLSLRFVGSVCQCGHAGGAERGVEGGLDRV